MAAYPIDDQSSLQICTSEMIRIEDLPRIFEFCVNIWSGTEWWLTIYVIRILCQFVHAYEMM